MNKAWTISGSLIGALVLGVLAFVFGPDSTEYRATPVGTFTLGQWTTILTFFGGSIMPAISLAMKLYSMFKTSGGKVDINLLINAGPMIDEALKIIPPDHPIAKVLLKIKAMLAMVPLKDGNPQTHAALSSSSVYVEGYGALDIIGLFKMISQLVSWYALLAKQNPELVETLKKLFSGLLDGWMKSQGVEVAPTAQSSSPSVTSSRLS